MGNLAILAKQAGYEISGYDGKIYPPMSELLSKAQIETYESFDSSHLIPPPKFVVVGNASMPRGTPALEYVLENGLNYLSGAEWLATCVLRDRHVIAVSGTHGKTTTTAMIAWILQCAGQNPGYLIGGAAKNFEQSVELGSGPHFVVEADEYDTSYFDRRSKFRHYRPKTLVIGNLEFDHADIFDDLDQIKYQFHHLIREVPKNGRVVVPNTDVEIHSVLNQGCWSPIQRFEIESASTPPDGTNSSAEFSARNIHPDGTQFDVFHKHDFIGTLKWSQMGIHNVANAMSAILAAEHVGVQPDESIEILCAFEGVRRRMELIARSSHLSVYSDFAHHPTAIRTTLKGLRDHVGTDRIIAVIEPRTHTMSLGTYRKELGECCSDADEVIWYRNKTIKWDMYELAQSSSTNASVHEQIEQVVNKICAPRTKNTHVVIMSNGGFDGIFQIVEDQLSQ